MPTFSGTQRGFKKMLGVYVTHPSPLHLVYYSENIILSPLSRQFLMVYSLNIVFILCNEQVTLPGKSGSI
jgi:hypothetical protein